MAPGVKIGRGPTPGMDSSTERGTWGVEAEELPEPSEAKVPEDISNTFK